MNWNKFFFIPSHPRLNNLLCSISIMNVCLPEIHKIMVNIPSIFIFMSLLNIIHELLTSTRYLLIFIFLTQFFTLCLIINFFLFPSFFLCVQLTSFDFFSLPLNQIKKNLSYFSNFTSFFEYFSFHFVTSVFILVPTKKHKKNSTFFFLFI